MAIPNGTLGLPQLAAKPSPPVAGAVIIYTRTDGVLYLQDEHGTEFAFGSVDFISALHGDVTATGPGDVPATVNSVGGSTAALIHSAELLANAATNINTASTIVRRDASGNFIANVATLNALALLGSVSGTLQIAAPSTFSSWTLTLPTTPGTANQSLITDGSGATSWASVLFQSLNDGKIWVGNGSNVPIPQTPGGDVSMTDLAVFTVNTVGTSSAANIHAAELLANAATSANTASAIVRRDASGNIAISALAAASAAFTGVADIVQVVVKGFAGQASDIFQVQRSDGTVYFKVDALGNATVLGTITASNFSGASSGTNTGDVTKTDTNSIAITLVAQNISADLKLSTDPADAGNLKITSSIHAGVGAAQGLHVEVPFATAVDVGTTNSAGSGPAISLANHVHAITIAVIGNLILTGYTIGTNVAIAATDTIFQALGKLQAQISATVGAAITALTGDVSASGPGSAAATVNSVGGKTAAAIAQSVTDTQAATSANTASTIVKRDPSGNFVAGTISAALSGNATTATTATNFTGSLAGDITGTQGATVVSKIQGVTVSGVTGTINVVFSASPTFTGTISAAIANFSGAVGINDNATAALVINTNSFVFDSTNNALGIGIQPGTNTFIDAVNTSGASKTLQLTGYGTGSTVGTRGRFARGTSGSPTAAQLGDIINFWSARGYGASQFATASTAAINAIAGENFTNTSNLTYLAFQTTPTGSVTSAESMRVASTGVTLGPQSASTAIHQVNGGMYQTTRTVTASFTIDTTTSDYIVLCNQSAGITITLPTPVIGRIIKIKDISGTASTNNITVARHASENIEGLAASKVLQTNFGAWTFTNDGTNWWMV